MAEGVSYSFPVLSSKKIVEYLGDLQINISEKVLLEPAKHSMEVNMVFEKLVQTTTGVTKEAMSQPDYAGLTKLSNPELHEESVSFMAFFHAVGKMMEVSKIDDFCLQDIQEPKRPRLRRQLSAVINFCRFLAERKRMYEELVARKQTVAAATREAQAQHDKLAEEFEAIQEKRAEKAKVIEEVAAECQAVEDEIAELNKRQAMVRDESSQLKKANHAAKDRVAGALSALQQAQVENERLQGQVVNSPRRILREVEDQKQALEQELADVESSNRSADSTEKYAMMLKQAQKEVSKAVAAVEQVATELSKQEVAREEVQCTKRKIMEKQEDRAAKEAQLEEDERKLHRLEEKLAHLRKLAVFKSEATAAELKDVRAEIQERQRNRNEATVRMKAKEPLVAQLRDEQEKLNQEIADQREEAKHLMREIGEICRVHRERLVAAMKESSVPRSTVIT